MLRSTPSAARFLKAFPAIQLSGKRTLVTSAPLLQTAPAPAAASKPQSLAQVIDDTIVATGPITVARYMQLCLTHPVWGYYSQGDVFGKEGDFITSPEISQIFGELAGVWLLTRWMAAGCPAECRIIELGPGRGTLMADVLRTFHTLGKCPVQSVHFVENSEKLRDVQKNTVTPVAEKAGSQLSWSNDLDEVPESPAFTMILAHEFFDAMPIHVLQHNEDGFREVRVNRNPSYLPAANNSRFIMAIDREPSLLSSLLPSSSHRFKRLPIGSRLEVSPDSSRIARRMGELISKGGAGLIVDYGGDRSFSSSFRAFQKHKIVDVFDNPGSADLTANVDFAYLRESMEGTAEALGPISQAKFLLSMGLEPRLSKLLAATSDKEQQERIRTGAKRLIDTTGMGTQYQVMGIVAGKGAEGEVYPFPDPKAKSVSEGVSSSASAGKTASE